ncbi:MAG: HIT family protein [Flexibacteraceae bacterium]
MASIFTKIINKEIPAFIVAEDEQHIAFLDIMPVAMGHVLVVPKKETDYVFHLSDSELSSLFVFAKKVALGIEKAVPCKKVGIAVIGLEVPHTHVHLVPMQNVGDINFAKEKLKPATDDLLIIAEQIKAYLS